MEQFYYHLGRGATPAEALRRAQLKLLSSSQYAHPFYWGAFAITGESADCVYRPFPCPWWWAGIGSGGALVLLWVWALNSPRRHEAL